MEGVVAAGLLAGLSVAVVNLSKNLSKSSRKVSQDMSVNSLRLEVFSSMKNTIACTNTLNGISSTGGAVASIRDAANSIIISSGGVYGNSSGNAQAKVSVTSIDFDSYTNTGSAYRSDPTLGATDRINGTANVSISFRRGSLNGGKTETDERALGGGNVRGVVRIPVRVVIDTTSNEVLSCSSAQLTYVDAFCDSFDGDSTYDSRCRHITIEDGVGMTDYAAKFIGNVEISDSDIAANTLKTLHVHGSTGVGRDADIANDGNLSVAHSVAVGSLTPSPAEVGSAHIGNSLGVGTTPDSGNNGSLKGVGSISIGSGYDVEPNTGSTSVKTALGVGIVAPPGAGNVRTTGNVGVGTDPETTATRNLKVGSLSIGSGVDYDTDGNILVEGFVHLPNQLSTDSNPMHVATQEWVSTKVANTLNPDAINMVNSILSDILGTNPNEVGASAVCQGFRIQHANTTYSARAAYTGSGCVLTPLYCNTNGQCTTVFAEGGGVNSSGSIISTGGNITTSSGHIDVTNGTAQARTIRAGTKICLPDNASFTESSAAKCKTTWSTITISRTGCYTKSSGQSCNSGDYLVRIAVSKQTVSPVTSVGHSNKYYAGRITAVSVSLGSSNFSVMNNLTYTCCKIRNQ